MADINTFKQWIESTPAQFKLTDWEDGTDFLKKKETAEFNRNQRNLEIEDKTFQIKTRKHLKRYFLILLAIQNFAVFLLVYIAYFQDELSDLSLIFGVIVSGTVTETIVVLKIIVQEIFKDIKYKDIK